MICIGLLSGGDFTFLNGIVFDCVAVMLVSIGAAGIGGGAGGGVVAMIMGLVCGGGVVMMGAGVGFGMVV